MGQALVVRYMKYGEAYPADDYVRAASPRVRARFAALAKWMADNGRLPDKMHGHWLKGEFSQIFEFKPRRFKVEVQHRSQEWFTVLRCEAITS